MTAATNIMPSRSISLSMQEAIGFVDRLRPYLHLAQNHSSLPTAENVSSRYDKLNLPKNLKEGLENNGPLLFNVTIRFLAQLRNRGGIFSDNSLEVFISEFLKRPFDDLGNRCLIEGICLYYPDLSRCSIPFDLKTVWMMSPNLQDICCPQVHWEGVQLLSEANLGNADLSDSKLNINASGAIFESANLFGSTIKGDLRNCDFRNAKLEEATISACLAGSNFEDATITNANFSEADLTNVDLTKAIGYESAIMKRPSRLQRAKRRITTLFSRLPDTSH